MGGPGRASAGPPPPRFRGPSRPLGGIGLLVALCLSISLASADDRADLPMPRPVNGTPKVPEGPPILPASYPAGLAPAMPVCLIDTLRLGVLGNLDIVQ